MILKIKEILEKNNIDYVFHNKNQIIPIDKIDVELIIENYPEEFPNKIEIMEIPEIEKATSGLSLLQFYSVLNLKLNEKESVKNDLLYLLSDINYTLATGAFLLNLQEEYIYLKYNLAIDQSQKIDLDLIITRTLWLINRHFDTYVGLFVQINNETLTYKEIKEKGL
jgi:hypothetical protein